MSKASNIDSLAELHERQAEVKQESELARKGFVDSLAQAPGKAKTFAYEDLAIPVMGIGVAAYVAYRLLRSNNRSKQNLPIPATQPPVLPVATAEEPAVRSQVILPAPRPVSPPPQEDLDNNAAKTGLSLAAIISVGRLLIPAAQAIMGAVQEHKANQKNSMEAGDKENSPFAATQEA